MHRHFSALAAVLVTAGALAVLDVRPVGDSLGAQGAGVGRGRGAGRGTAAEQAEARQRFRGMDTNNDGAISRAEWRGSDQSFRVHDWNRDGILSGTEINQAVRDSAGDVVDDYDPLDTYNNWSAARFTALDTNRDGRIVRSEWRYDAESFTRADRNRDGALVRAEFIGGDFDDDRGDRFDFLDADGNNRVTRDEWHASDAAFQWMDRNNDNVLSRQEMQGDDADQQVVDAFARLDTNRDNRLARTEWGYSSGSFNALDTDDNGFLTRREFAGNGVNTNAGTVTSSVTVTGTTRWTDANVVVYAGDTVAFQATGTVRMAPGGDDIADPRGSRTGRLAPDAPLPEQPAGALIGRVDNGAPFLIGANTSPIRMRQTGRLYLSSNDDYLGDNSGEFRVAVRVQRTAQ